MVIFLQITDLLRAPKDDFELLPDLLQCCNELNSLQIGTILREYRPAQDEEPISRGRI